MLKELLNKTYQNFYVNDDNIIVGMETPKKHWKIFKPELLGQHYIDTIARCKALNTNFEPIKVKIAKYEKMLKRLENAMKKLNQ
jgi:hypothetical protein